MGRTTIAIAALLCVACGEDTVELSIDLRTDYVPVEEFDRVEVLIDAQPIRAGATGSDARLEAMAIGDADYVRGVRIGDAEGLPATRHYVRLQLLDGPSVVAEVSAIVALGGSRVLTMVVSKSCAGVSCPGEGDPASASSCLGGVCVDPECDPDEVGSCGVGECIDSVDCADPAGCLRAVCVAGACLEERDDAMCSPGNVCAGDGSCAAIATDMGPPPPRDFGPPPPIDMGPPDLGPDLSDTFCPDAPTSRAQFARFAVRYMHPGFDPAAWTYRGTFTDVPSSHPFAAEIEQLAADGITSGCEVGEFCPNAPLLRRQAAVFFVRIWRGVGFTPPDVAGVFTDVPDSAAYHDHAEYLRTQSIMNGCGSTTFCPADPMTRQQTAIVFVRLIDGPTPSLPPYVGYFSDVPAGNAFAEYIERFAVLGYTRGC